MCRFEIAVVVGLALAVAPLRTAADPVLDTAAISQSFGRPGTMMAGDVFRIGLPRTDLHVAINGLSLRPSFALGGYAVFKAEPGGTLLIGDIPLLQSEVVAVRKSLESSDFLITALHNHLLNEEPRVVYLHYMKVGDAASIAGELHRALALSGMPLGVLPSPPPPNFAEAAMVQQALGRTGTVTGEVLAISVPRAESITLQGMALPPAMGVATALNFEPAGSGRVSTTGDFVLTAPEVIPVQRELAAHGIEMTALHSHMLGEYPALYYMHFWAVGKPADVAVGLKAALAHVNVKKSS